MSRPTLAQRIIASDRLWSLSMLGLAVGTSVWFVSDLELSAASLRDPYAILWTIAVAMLAFIAGWFAALIPLWITLAPICYAQAEKNGGPFAIGDTVEIISGPHRGVVTTIYAKSQFDTNRVDLGEQAREKYSDIYANHQLLRRDENMPAGHS